MLSTISAILIARNRDIKIFKSNQIKKPVPETLIPIQKIHLKILFY